MLRHAAALAGLSVASATVYFSETFSDDNWSERWLPSAWKESEGSQGTWELNAGKYYENAEEDQGLFTPADSKFYGISAAFPSFSNEGKTLVVQYQAKYEKDVECGGGYIKLGPKLDDAAKFGDPTPYNIMFGPDKCGSNKRTHLIFSSKGVNYLKRADLPYKQDIGLSTLYTLIVRPDASVAVKINGEEVYSGTLAKDWDILPSAEIDDPDDKKPADWIDESTIDDPEDVKPDTWVDDEYIEDPDSTKPDTWDDEEDGEWTPTKKKNPDYRGPWMPKRIKNPEYKGVWLPRKIPNPDHNAEDADTVYSYPDFSFVGLDLWQVKAGTIFDNFIITDSEAEAETFAEKWKARKAAEEKMKKDKEASAEKPQDDKPDVDADDDDIDDEDL